MKPILVSLVVVLAVTSSSAQECPKVAVQQDFDPQKFVGMWYEIQRDPSPFQPSGDCANTVYEFSSDTSKMTIDNRMFLKDGGQFVRMVGEARLAEPSARDGRMIVKVPIAPIEANVWVVDTDYDNYAILHSCNNLFGMVIKMSFVMSKTTTFTPEVQQLVVDALAKSGVDSGEFESTTQGGSCKY